MKVNKTVKSILIVGAIFLGVVGLIIFINIIFPLLIGFKVLNSFIDKQEARYDFNEKGVIEYVKDTHDLDVEIIDKFDTPGYRVTAHSFIVQTQDDERIIFDVKKAAFMSKIKGDNYEEMKKYHTIIKEVKSSQHFKELEELGFIDFYYGFDWLFSNSHVMPKLKLILPEGEKYTEEVIEQIYKALTIIQSIEQHIFSQYDEEIDRVSVHSNIEYKQQDFQGVLTIDVADKNKSLEKFHEDIAEQHRQIFSKELIKPHLSTLEKFEKDFSMFQFINNDITRSLTCYDIETVDLCNSFLLMLGKNSEESAEKFQYDDPSFLDELWSVIQLIQAADVPINQLEIRGLKVPDDLDYQTYSEEELLEQDVDTFITFKDVLIEDVETLKDRDDLYFVEVDQ